MKGELGGPRDYEVSITGRTNDDPHSKARWSTITWGRQLSDMSEASIECPWVDLFNSDGKRARPCPALPLLPRGDLPRIRSQPDG